MQAKVSMAMPCYNKEEYIGDMFGSIIAQKWNNIELILVNDGSTDGTRDIIAEYVPKFLARGFEVIVIDQDNAGVCAAAKAGLHRVTGDYVCIVDADDELDPEYVSTMAGWLEEHPEHDYAVCSHLRYTGAKESRIFSSHSYPPAESDCANMTELYLLARVFEEPWAYMTRRAYFDKCRIPESYDVSTRGSHEPGFMVPLTAHGGRLKAFQEALYRHDVEQVVTHSRPAGAEKMLGHILNYFELCKRAIASLPENVADEHAKNRYVLAAYTRFVKKLLAKMKQLGPEAIPAFDVKEMLGKYYEIINTALSPSMRIGAVTQEEAIHLAQAVEDNILGIIPRGLPQKISGRVVAWGALGIRGRRILPGLAGTVLEPDELWDAAGDGTDTKKPNPGSLGPDDSVLVLPIGEVSDQICAELKETGCAVMLSKDILACTAFIKFPQFYRGMELFSGGDILCSQR